MGRPEVPASLSEIKNPTSIQEQIAALKQLKNEIIGHPLIKELVINNGIAAPLVRNLQTSLKASGKRRSREVNGNGVYLDKDYSWTHEDELRLQTITIITSLAHGGPPLVRPLLAQGVLPPLLSALSPAALPARLVVETLRAINVIAEAESIKFDSDGASLDEPLENALLSKSTIDALAEILAQRGRSAAINEQYTLSLKLIACTVRTKRARQALVKAGVLDLLASKLAAFANEDLRSSRSSMSADILPPVPPRSSLPHLLDAITQLIRGSSYRSMRLIYNKDIHALFPAPFCSHVGSSTNTVNYLLPKLEAMQGRPGRDIQKAFPALNGIDKGLGAPRGKSDAPSILIPDEVVSPFESWLVQLARTTVGMERLSAVWLLGHLIPAFSKVCPEMAMDAISIRTRERNMALLVVPMIVKMIEEATQKSTPPPKPLPLADQHFLALVRERAPRALGKLIEDSSTLQKAAVDAGAVKVLSQLLKKTFDPFSPSRQTMWSPSSISPTSPLAVGVTVTQEAIHSFQTRSAALRAIAILGQKEDNPRRYIIEASVMQSIYDSLQPLGSGKDVFSQSKATASLEANPSDVLIAACKAVTALSRSVSILRTSLIDARIAKPVFRLLRHPNVKVQLAAIAATTNLVLNFSPMREVSAKAKEAGVDADELVSSGVVSVLCDHARSANPKLRVNSLWALKHLVVSADQKLKCSCLESLGTGWLVQILSTEPRENGPAQRSHMATANAAGEQVDLLNAVDESSMDIDSDLEAMTDEDDEMGDVMHSLRMAQTDSDVRRALRRTLRVIKETEENPALIARNDDIRIQEQALDFIRNLIGEPGPGQHDMIEYLLLGFGANRLFELLTAKLKARPTSAQASAPVQPPRGPAGKQPKLSISSSTMPSVRPTFSTLRPPASETSRELWLNTPTDLIISTLFILIHIANGRPSHRHLLISQSPLMDALLPCFTHPDRRVKVACCWLVHTLTWQEDAADAGGARTRAAMLRERGVEAVVRGLVNDEDLDTRERAKGVSDVIRRLLDGGDGPMTGGFVSAGLGSSESRVWSR